MKRKKDFEIKFWKDWLNADMLKRQNLVKNLLIVKKPLKTKDSKLNNNATALLLNSYFEDLESAIYTKIRLEEEK